jgi:hypothetical protein
MNLYVDQQYTIILDALYDAPALQLVLPISFVGTLDEARNCDVIDGGPVAMLPRSDYEAIIKEPKTVWHMGALREMDGAIYLLRRI